MGRPASRNSPVHNCLKFSAVLGTTSAKSSTLTLPAGKPPIEISKKTTGLSGCLSEYCPASYELIFINNNLSRILKELGLGLGL